AASVRRAERDGPPRAKGAETAISGSPPGPPQRFRAQGPGAGAYRLPEHEQVVVMEHVSPRPVALVAPPASSAQVARTGITAFEWAALFRRPDRNLCPSHEGLLSKRPHR